MYLARIGKG